MGGTWGRMATLCGGRFEISWLGEPKLTELLPLNKGVYR